MKTSKEQLEHVKDWERRNPGRAQARKNNWFKTAKGLAWIKKNQKRRTAKRKLWRAKKRRQAANDQAQRRRRAGTMTAKAGSVTDRSRSLELMLNPRQLACRCRQCENWFGVAEVKRANECPVCGGMKFDVESPNDPSSPTAAGGAGGAERKHGN